MGSWIHFKNYGPMHFTEKEWKMYVTETVYSFFNISVADETEEQHKELIRGLRVDTKVCGDFECVIFQK